MDSQGPDDGTGIPPAWAPILNLWATPDLFIEDVVAAFLSEPRVWSDDPTLGFQLRDRMLSGHPVRRE